MRARAVFEVSWGVIPGQQRDTHSVKTTYTDADYKHDSCSVRRLPPGVAVPTRFTEKRDAALKLAREKMNPTVWNWVRIDFMWL